MKIEPSFEAQERAKADASRAASLNDLPSRAGAPDPKAWVRRAQAVALFGLSIPALAAALKAVTGQPQLGWACLLAGSAAAGALALEHTARKRRGTTLEANAPQNTAGVGTPPLPAEAAVGSTAAAQATPEATPHARADEPVTQHPAAPPAALPTAPSATSAWPTTVAEWAQWGSGYPLPLLRGASEACRGTLAKTGAGVLFASVFASFSWGLAAFTYTTSLPLWARLPIAAAAALFGGSLALVFDRPMIYFADTTSRVSGVTKGFVAQIAARVSIVVAMGMITAAAIVTPTMQPELTGHAQKMREAASAMSSAKALALESVTDLAQMAANEQTRADRIKSELPELERNANHASAEAKKCGQELQRLRRAATPAQPAALEEQAARCQTLKAREDQAKKTLNDKKAQQDQATQSANQAAQKKVDAADRAKAGVAKADQERVAALTWTNPEVLADLIKTSPAARFKYFLISFILLVCELMPLILKLQAGQTQLGARIAAERMLNQARHQAEADAELITLRIQQEAYASEAVRAALRVQIEADLQAQAPLLAAMRSVNQLNRTANQAENLQGLHRHASAYVQRRLDETFRRLDLAGNAA